MVDTAVFSDVWACATAKPQTQPTPGHRITWGLIWGRAEREESCIAVIDSTAAQLVALIRWHGGGYSANRDMIMQQNAVWKPSVIWADIGEIGGPTLESLWAEGLPVQPIHLDRFESNRLLRYLHEAFYHKAITIFPEPSLMHQLGGYTIDQNPVTGTWRYFSIDEHACVLALALGWHGAQATRLNIQFKG